MSLQAAAPSDVHGPLEPPVLRRSCAVPVGLALGTVWILGGRPRELATAAIPPLLQSSDRYVAGVPRVLHAADVFWRPSNQLGVPASPRRPKPWNSGTLGARLWRLAPGQFSTLHRHLEQVELYVVLAGSGRIRVGGETHTLAPLSAVLVEPEVEVVVPEVAEVISLEEVEEAGAEAAIEEDEEIVDLGDDAPEIPAGDDDNAFLEEEEEGEADVTGIVGTPGEET